MAKYGRKASEAVARAMRERSRGTLRSGRSGRKVTSRAQAIAIGLSEAREAGAKVPARRKQTVGKPRKRTAARKTTNGKRAKQQTASLKKRPSSRTGSAGKRKAHETRRR